MTKEIYESITLTRNRTQNWQAKTGRNKTGVSERNNVKNLDVINIY